MAMKKSPDDSSQEAANAPASIAAARRLVVKIGSSLLVEAGDGAIKRAWLDGLADDLAQCHRAGQQAIVVSSGAIAVGRRHLKLGLRGLRLEEKQAAAAVGQIRLAHAYQESLARHDVAVAQVLLTIDDTEERRRHLNARSTLETLLRMGVIPVINENDTVATEEIRFGDNDRLAARVAQMASADTLVLLSDIDGLYTGDPVRDPKATWIPEIRALTPEIEAMAGEARAGYSSGGMVTKLMAGRIAMAAGCRMVIASGLMQRPLSALLAGARCTWFLPTAEPGSARKQWIAGAVKPAGSLTVDAGAEKALNRGKSLLPAGVVAVEGKFERGDSVLVKSADGRELGRGLIAYSSDDARRIVGQKSDKIEEILGYRGREEMIHRDNLAIG